MTGIKRWRLPTNWRERMPDSRLVYRDRLRDLSEPDREGWAAARCPFHEGADQSIAVDLASDWGGWRCRFCDSHGDLITFVRLVDGLSFPAAVRMLMGVARDAAPSANAAAHIQRCRALLAENMP